MLARTQTEQTIERLRELVKEQMLDVTFETVFIQTTGDRVLDVSLSKVGGKGLFTKEIEQALADGAIDVAVHSMKDVPFEMDDLFCIAAIPIREDARDAWLSTKFESWDDLDSNAVVGTSSLRRSASLKSAKPSITIKMLRGNVDTRYQKMVQGDYDGIILAAAGLHRLGWKDRIRSYVPIDNCLPAVGQGALALQCRSDDRQVIDVISLIHDSQTGFAVQAERAFLRMLEGSCQVPIGGYAAWSENELLLNGMIAMSDGSNVLRGSRRFVRKNEHSNLDIEQQVILMGEELAAELRNHDQGSVWNAIRGVNVE